MVDDFGPIAVLLSATPVLAYHNCNSPWVLWFLSLLFLLAPPFLIPRTSNALLIQVAACCGSCCAFKLAALAVRRGVLKKELATGAGVWRFSGVLLLPVIPSPAITSKDGSKGFLPLVKLISAIIKIVAFTFLISISVEPALHFIMSQSSWQRQLLWLAFNYVFGFALWLEVDGAGDLMDAIAFACFGIDPEIHFKYPPLTTGLADLWGHRWNLTISTLLRDLVYQPVIEGQMYPQNGKPEATDSQDSSSTQRHDSAFSIEEEKGGGSKGVGMQVHKEQLSETGQHRRCSTVRPSRARKTLGSMAAFLFSGVWHELVFVQITFKPDKVVPLQAGVLGFLQAIWANVHTSRGLWTLFFLIQAPAIAIERFLAHQAGSKGIHIPRWLATPATNVIFTIMTSLFWMPPMFWELSPPLHASPHDIAEGTSLLSQLIWQARHDSQALSSLAHQAVSYFV